MFLAQNILKSIGDEFFLNICNQFFGITPPLEDKSPEILLMSWITEKTPVSPSFKKAKECRSPKYSILSFDTENSGLFSEKFSFVSKKNKPLMNVLYFMKSHSVINMSPLIKKKYSPIENFEITELNEDSQQRYGEFTVFSKKKQSVTIIQNDQINENNDDIFRNLLFNEIKNANDLLLLMKNDLFSLLEYLEGKSDCSNKVQEILLNLKRNEIPEGWWKKGSILKEQNLYEFLKSLLLKKEFLHTIVFQRKCEMVPVIPLGKLFDPFGFLLSFAWRASEKMNVN